MSQIYISPDIALGLPLSITNANEITGATEHALVIGGAAGQLTPLAVAGNGEIPIGSIGADPVLTTITEGANITVTNGPGSITITATGIGIGPEFADDLFRVYDDTVTTKKLAFQCDQITAANTRTITMCDQDLSLISPSFPGSVTAGTGLVVTTGDAQISAGNIDLPATNSSRTRGAITFGGDKVLHTLGASNIFLGKDSGASIISADSSVGVGAQSLQNLTTGEDNVAVGTYSLSEVTTGQSNIAVGYLSMGQLTSGDYNIGIGETSALNYTGSESSNICIGSTGFTGESHKIRIGEQGIGDQRQNNTFIAGIYGVTPTAVARTAIIDANGELGTLGAATNGQIPIGSTGANQVLATLTAGADIGIANGAGTITISYTGSTGLAWSEVTGTTQAAAVDSGYITNNAAQVVVTLPDTAALGSVVRIEGKGAGGFKIAQNAGETIYWNASTATTTGVGGYLESTDRYDSIELLCITAGTDWKVSSVKGNVTVV